MIVGEGAATFILGNNARSAKNIYYAMLLFFVKCLGCELLENGEVEVGSEVQTLQWSGKEIFVLDESHYTSFDVNFFESVPTFI